MFIIKEGTPYLIYGDKAKKAKFSVNGLKVSENEEDIVDIKGEQKYTYDEVYKKLNVAYYNAIEMASKKKTIKPETKVKETKVEKENVESEKPEKTKNK